MLVDTHCHLNFKVFGKDVDQVINRAKKADVEEIIIPGAKLDSSEKAVEIARQYKSCYAAVGIHPHHVAEFIILGNDTVISRLEELINGKKVIAVGEIGLDYYTYHNYPPILAKTKKVQEELLLLQLELAYKTKLPVIIHCREAFQDLLPLIKKFISQKPITGVFHCFSGDKKHLKKVIEFGFFVGFDGNITYKENQNLRQCIKFIPLDRLLLETDSPFLTPVPFRGKRNEPKLITYTAKRVAEIRNLSLAFIADTTSQNARKLFNI